MRSKVERHSEEAEKAVRDIRRATRRQLSLVKTSNPNILMMEPAENRQRDDASNSV